MKKVLVIGGGRIGAAIAERDVVFARALLIRVAFDDRLEVGVGFQPLCVAQQDLLTCGRDRGLVYRKKDPVADGLAEVNRAGGIGCG